MPPKRNTRAVPAAAAVVADRGETPPPNATAAARAAQRRAREEPAEEQRVVRPRQEVVEQTKWEWSSHVSDILLHRIDPKIGDTKLRDFIREHVREDYPIEQIDNYTMDVVVEGLEECVTDGDLRRRIEGREAFQKLRVAHQAMKDADILEQRGIVTLEQWRDFGEKDIVSPRSKGTLNGVRVQSPEIPQGGQVLAGLYESIYDAKWDYVVKSHRGSKKNFWLEVKQDNSPPPQEWTDWQVDYLTHNVDTRTANGIRNAREEELKEDEDNAEPTQERLVMKVLTSPKGWPYGLYRDLFIYDCFVTKEVERVWRVVRNDLRDWFEADPRVLGKPRQRVLIGTPGIGKSMGVGSYLLHQLLQYDTEILPVVAYFITHNTYIFNKTTKQVTLYNDVEGLSMVKGLAKAKNNGYTIYDCSKRVGEPPVDLPRPWGTVLISSPDENNFKGWVKQKTACRFIINCPEERDIKAMWVWNMRAQTDGPQMDWASIKNRMSTVGPIPRFIFCDDTSYNDCCEIVQSALDNIDANTVPQYYGMGKHGFWQSKKVTRIIVKITRLVRSNGVEIICNKPICPELEGKIRERVSEALKTDAVLMAILLPLNELIPCILETVGVEAFKEKNFVDRIHDKLTEFRPKDSKRPGKHWTLYEDIWAFPDVVISVPQKTAVKKTNLQFKKLYISSSETFPVVDAFFFVKKTKTIVGIQVAKSKYHDTTTSKVKALREYLAALFVESDSFPTDFTWEIVYVQHKDNIPMTHWQECKMDLPPGQGPAHNSIREEHLAIAKHWNEEVYQYHLKISSADIRGNR